MKKLLALLLAVTMVFALTACVDVEGLVSNLGSDFLSDLATAFPDTDSLPDASLSTDSSDSSDISGGDTTSDGTLSVAEFLALYGFVEADITPENFVSFDPVETEGKSGEAGYSGFIKINVEKGATDQEDIDAWFDKIFAAIQSRSDDGKLYKNYLFEEEATSLADLKSGPTWSILPGFGPYFYKDTLLSGKVGVVFTARYDTQKDLYSVGITLWGPVA